MHILILNRWPQFPDSDRWDNSLANYPELIDHAKHRVSYICTQSGMQGQDFGQAAVVRTIADFRNRAAVLAAAREIEEVLGAIDRVVAFSEYLLDVAAMLRDAMSIEGAGVGETNRFRDKSVMKQRLRRDSIRVPRWWRFDTRTAFENIAFAAELPLIFKPVRGASSQGVVKVETQAQIHDLAGYGDLGACELEEYIDGTLYHVDGVVNEEGTTVFACVSRYITPCLNFELGEPLGSVIVSEPAVQAPFMSFSRHVLTSLELKSSAFHLEVFDRDGELIFLEIGARVPGADVSYVVNEVYGVNLFQLWVDATMGCVAPPVVPEESGSGGWLIIPRPKQLPCRVHDVTSLKGRVPGVYRELVPDIGAVLQPDSGYANLQSGRFLFSGTDTESVAEAIDAAKSAFHIETAPIRKTA